MKKVFHLSSCDTCQKIIKNTQVDAICELQDIKKQNISAEELDWLASKTGSYEALFSRKALKYRAMGLHEKTLTEGDYRRLILEEYTFLKRPVIVIDDRIFVGNAPKIVQEAKEYILKLWQSPYKKSVKPIFYKDFVKVVLFVIIYIYMYFTYIANKWAKSEFYCWSALPYLWYRFRTRAYQSVW